MMRGILGCGADLAVLARFWGHFARGAAFCAAACVAHFAWAENAPTSANLPASAANVAETAQNLHHWRLDNGLEFIVQVDRRAPTAVHMVWVRVGSIDEASGTSGVAHMLEHMMFKGTPTMAPGAFSRHVAELGGRDNAFTSRDYTAYFQQVPAAALREVMALEADRFAHNHWADEEFAREMAVVQEERRQRTDDVPRALFMEQLMAAAWTAHPYRRPVIGWMDDLRAMTADDVRTFWRRWYTPANVAVVIVGDVDVEQVRAWSQQLWGAWTGPAVPTRKPQAEPAQLGARRITVQQDVHQPQVAILWHAPTIGDLQNAPTQNQKDALALMVLSAILDGYEGARLEKALVQGISNSKSTKSAQNQSTPNLGPKTAFVSSGNGAKMVKNAQNQPLKNQNPKRWANAVGASADVMGRGAGAFMLMGTPADGVLNDDLILALKAEIDKIAHEGVENAELERVKIQWRASQIYERDSMMGQAMNYGMGWAAGMPLDADNRLMQMLENITTADIQRVAKMYFQEKGMNIGVLIPEKSQ